MLFQAGLVLRYMLHAGLKAVGEAVGKYPIPLDGNKQRADANELTGFGDICLPSPHVLECTSPDLRIRRKVDEPATT